MESSESESGSESVEINSMNINANDSEYEHKSWPINNELLVVSCIVHSIIFVLGLVGNIFVCYSVFREKSKQTVTNVFMSSLAVANILLCLLVVPIQPVYWLASNWPLGSFMCHLWPCIYYSVCYGSTLVLASIAVNRYSVTVHQLRNQMKMRKLMRCVVIIWLISIAASLPFGISFAHIEYTDPHNNRHASCVPQWPSKSSYSTYFTTTFVIFLIIPSIVTVYYYVLLSLKMSRMSNIDCSTQMADVRRTNRLSIAMAIVLFICWVPHHVIELMVLVDRNVHNWEHIVTVARVAHVMEMSSTCFTPVFYMCLNKISIKQFCLVLPCFNHPFHQKKNENESGQPYTVLINEDRADDVTYDTHCDAVNVVSLKRDG